MKSMERSAFYQELCETFDRTPIIDSHEHLPKESARLEQKVDFTTLFAHYTRDNFYAAGMSLEQLAQMQSPDTDLERKWELFSAYYPMVRDTSYVRSARIAMEKFYGCGDLTSFAQAEAVTQRMRQANKPGLYDRVLRQACHMEHSFLFTCESEHIERDGFYQYVDYVDPYCQIASRADAEGFGRELGGACGTLDEVVQTLHEFIRAKAERGVRGIKYLVAYNRTLRIDRIEREDALRIWEKLPIDGAQECGQLTEQQKKALQDYLLYRTLECCEEFGLPAVFHTGIQTGPGNMLIHTDPLPLTNTLQAFPNVKFVLLHCGIPWTDQAAILAKYFSNVYIDMAWLHIVSPDVAVKGLKRWLDLLPMNKILGFGGDYLIVEKVYGHLCIARENLCRALTEKADEIGLTQQRAQLWLRRLVHDNAEAVYFPERFK